jgi:hypothetical protein
MIFSSEKMAYDGKKYTVPLWRFDSDSFTVLHINEETHLEERTSFHSECIRFHVKFTVEHCPERFQKLVDNGEIFSYLENFEDRVYNAIDSQVDKWKAENPDYIAAHETGNYIKQAGIENMLEMQAKEAIYNAMVYV